ncbi:MAG: CoA transferase [Dehalococcoidia bacterium]|nr:CoA transferase [Dehalococcoidia bacterium]
MAGQALSDMRVIDLTRYIAGPVCTKFLADYGADVIKIERPGVGDGARNMGPFYHDEPHPEKSGLFLYLNNNKRGITLNLKSKLGKEIFRELVKKADVVVENFKPGVMERLGLGYEELEKLNPSLVMTSISNFGQTGPYSDYKLTELITLGMGGPMHSTGVAEREPLKYAEHISIYHSGVVSAMSTMVAFYGSRYGGVGQRIDISIMETQAGSVHHRAYGLTTYRYNGRSTPRGGILGARYPQGVYPCADGYIVISATGARLSRAVEMLGNPPELMDPKWYTREAPQDPELEEEFDGILLGWCMEHTKQEIFELGQKAGVIVAPMNTIDEAFKDPQFNDRGIFTEVEHPVMGKVQFPGRPFIMPETPWAMRRPAPLLGQHNSEVYSELGYTKEDMVMLRETGVI